MKTSLFHFDLRQERIAIHPVSPRDASRLLVVDGSATRDSFVRDLPDLLRPGDLMVFNDTKVISAQLTGRRGEAKIKITLISYKGDGNWQAFAKPAKRLKKEDIIRFNNGFPAKVLEKHEDGGILLKWEHDDWQQCIERYGEMPLPPYVKREPQAIDKQNYQTVYARHSGAVAAPTAGLHFTPELLSRLDAKGIKQAKLTLHVGAGTFLPVKTDDVEDHVMHEEFYEISNELADAVNLAREEGRRIVAVGTTVLRALEASADSSGKLKGAKVATSIFITPGYPFRIVDVLMTNFHLPRSTLFILVCAFSGMETMHKAYRHAIDENYRFYSYGDACLLTRA